MTISDQDLIDAFMEERDELVRDGKTSGFDRLEEIAVELFAIWIVSNCEVKFK